MSRTTNMGLCLGRPQPQPPVVQGRPPAQSPTPLHRPAAAPLRCCPWLASVGHLGGQPGGWSGRGRIKESGDLLRALPGRPAGGVAGGAAV